MVWYEVLALVRTSLVGYRHTILKKVCNISIINVTIGKESMLPPGLFSLFDRIARLYIGKCLLAGWEGRVVSDEDE